MDVCSECPIRLFNNKHYNLQGIGNPYFGNCIVVPNVDYNAYKNGSMGFSNQVEIIKDVLFSFTGEGDNVDSLYDLYIVPLIRCNETISCELDNNSYNRCLHHFANDMRKYQFKRILLLGDAGRRFLNCDITENLNTLMVSANNKFYNINYSPLIKYKDDEKFNIFKTYLIKWYNWCKSQVSVYDKIINI